MPQSDILKVLNHDKWMDATYISELTGIGVYSTRRCLQKLRNNNDVKWKMEATNKGLSIFYKKKEEKDGAK